MPEPDPPRKWKRKNYGPNERVGRELFELEADRDLDKSIEQLVCDVHEETHVGSDVFERLANAQKRFASLMGRVALSNDKVARQMLWLTWAIAILTGVIVLLELIHLCGK
jgi:fructose-1,6-bisphosphatase